MKPVVFPKTGYSLKISFSTLLKYCILIISFSFLGMIISNKVEADELIKFQVENTRNIVSNGWNFKTGIEDISEDDIYLIKFKTVEPKGYEVGISSTITLQIRLTIDGNSYDFNYDWLSERLEEHVNIVYLSSTNNTSKAPAHFANKGKGCQEEYASILHFIQNQKVSPCVDYSPQVKNLEGDVLILPFEYLKHQINIRVWVEYWGNRSYVYHTINPVQDGTAPNADALSISLYAGDASDPFAGTDFGQSNQDGQTYQSNQDNLSDASDPQWTNKDTVTVKVTGAVDTYGSTIRYKFLNKQQREYLQYGIISSLSKAGTVFDVKDGVHSYTFNKMDNGKYTIAVCNYINNSYENCIIPERNGKEITFKIRIDQDAPAFEGELIAKDTEYSSKQEQDYTKTDILYWEKIPKLSQSYSGDKDLDGALIDTHIICIRNTNDEGNCDTTQNMQTLDNVKDCTQQEKCYYQFLVKKPETDEERKKSLMGNDIGRVTLPWGQGVYYITYTVVDEAGNIKVVDTFKITYVPSSQAPVIESFNVFSTSNVASNGYTSTMEISFHIVAKSPTNIANIVAYEIIQIFNGIEIPVYFGKENPAEIEEFTYALADEEGKNQGEHQLILFVYDQAGNRTSDSASIRYIVGNPSISKFEVRGKESSKAGYTNTRKDLLVVIESEPRLSELKDYYITDDDDNILELYKDTDGNLYIKELDALRTKYNLTLTLTNYTLTYSSEEVEVILDETSPKKDCKINLIQDKAWANHNIELTFNNCDDIDTSRISYKKSLEGSWITTSGEKLYIKVPENSFIDTYYNFRIYDIAGNSSDLEGAYLIKVDTMAPTVTGNLVVGNGNAVNGFTNQINGLKVLTVPTANDNHSGVALYTIKTKTLVGEEIVETILYQGETLVINQELNFIYELEGKHRLFLVVEDKAGNIAEIEYESIVYDKTAPEIVTGNLVPDGVLQDGVLTTGKKKVQFASFPEINEEYIWKYELVAFRNSTIVGTSKYENGLPSIATVELSDQEVEYTFEYYVYDKAGNRTRLVSTVGITLDLTPPSYKLEGAENKGITDADVTLTVIEPDKVLLNNQEVENEKTFTEDGYYRLLVKDLVGNITVVEFTINKKNFIKIGNENVTFYSQNNTSNGKFIVEAKANYPANSGYIYAKVLANGTLEYVDGALFTDEEYNLLQSGEDLEFYTPIVGNQSIVAFVVTAEEFAKFNPVTETKGMDDIILYGIAAVAIALFMGTSFIIMVKGKSKKYQEEAEMAIDEDLFK